MAPVSGWKNNCSYAIVLCVIVLSGDLVVTAEPVCNKSSQESGWCRGGELKYSWIGSTFDYPRHDGMIA